MTDKPGEALVPMEGPAALALADALGAKLTPISLDITDPKLTYTDWENIGRCISFAGNAWQWWVGDWINIGETLYGEEAAQGIDDPSTRYDLMRRVTGSEQQTLLNVASVTRKVSRGVRRAELRFSHHAVVAPLDANQQRHWLALAVRNQWTVKELRDAIRDELNPPNDEDQGAASQDIAGPTLAERLEEAARHLRAHAQPMDNGRWADEAAWSQLDAVLGER